LTDDGRGAALFTGVFSALEALPVAREALPGLGVQLNTGLTPPSVRKASRDADLLIGTATVDTGVDLQINRLLFEAYDAGNFKQRLGRRRTQLTSLCFWTGCMQTCCNLPYRSIASFHLKLDAISKSTNGIRRGKMSRHLLLNIT